MQHRAKTGKVSSAEKAGAKVGASLSTFFKNLIPDTAEKLNLAKEKNRGLNSILDKVKTKISSRDLSKFILKGLQGVEEVERTQQPAANKYSKFLLSRVADDLAAAYIGLESELRFWELELNNGAAIDSYPHKDLNRRILELDKKATDAVKECKKSLEQRISGFNSTLDAALAEMNSQLNSLKQQKDLAAGASTLLRDAYQHLINHYVARIKNVETAKENFNAAFGDHLQAGSNENLDNIEQLFGVMDAITLHEGKRTNYEAEQNSRAEVLDAELKKAIEHDNLVRQIDKKWETLRYNILTQRIRNNNFLEGFPDNTQQQLKNAWAAIEEENVKLQKEITANRKNKQPDVGTSNNLSRRVAELENSYKEYRPLYRKAEHERRKVSEVNILVTEMIGTIDAATRSNALDETTQAAWTTWKQEANNLKQGYENLRLMGRYENNIDKIGEVEAEHMAQHFSSKKIDEDFGNRILKLKLSPAQYNQLASSHDLTTRSGRFNHAMHQFFTRLKKIFKSSDEYASTFFAAPAAIKVKELEGRWEETQKKGVKPSGGRGG